MSPTTMYGIDPSAPVSVDAGEIQRTTWGQFLADNEDGIVVGDVDPEAVAEGLLRRPGCTYFGGGGAAAQWSIRLLAEGDVA